MFFVAIHIVQIANTPSPSEAFKHIEFEFKKKKGKCNQY